MLRSPQATRQLLLGVTLYKCKDGASVPTPECEQNILWAVLQEALQAPAARQQLAAAGEFGLGASGRIFCGRCGWGRCRCWQRAR